MIIWTSEQKEILVPYFVTIHIRLSIFLYHFSQYFVFFTIWGSCNLVASYLYLRGQTKKDNFIFCQNGMIWYISFSHKTKVA